MATFDSLIVGPLSNGLQLLPCTSCFSHAIMISVGMAARLSFFITIAGNQHPINRRWQVVE